MKILITGTHFTPAQAVIEELQKDSQTEIVYIGRKYTQEGDNTLSVESAVLPKLGVKFIPITTGRLQRSFTVYTIPSLVKVPFGFLQAFYFLLREKPDVVLSFGGYVSVPVVVAAWFLSIPLIIHEQTLISGLANKISSLFADKIALSFTSHELSKNSKAFLTGNPLRKELFSTDDKMVGDYQEIINNAKKNNLPLIYITGGNQGSHAINTNVKDNLEELTKVACVVHQTGESKFNDFEDLLLTQKQLTHPERYLVKKWVDGQDVGLLFRNSDIGLMRAGMNTLLEAAFFTLPVLLVPILNHKEQAVNAKFFKEKGLAQILWQSDLSSKNLLQKIKEMLGHLDQLKEQSKSAKELVIPDAAKRLALETIILAKIKR